MQRNRCRGLDCNERWLPKGARRARISWLYGIRNAAERVSQGRRQCEMPCLNHRLANCLDLQVLLRLESLGVGRTTADKTDDADQSNASELIATHYCQLQISHRDV